MRSLVYAAPARKDLDEISDYIAERNLNAADQLYADIQDAIELLRSVPGIGHQRPELTDRSFRCHNVGAYVIIYRYDDKSFTVLRVVHGRRDFKKLLRP